MFKEIVIYIHECLLLIWTFLVVYSITCCEGAGISVNPVWHVLLFTFFVPIDNVGHWINHKHSSCMQRFINKNNYKSLVNVIENYDICHLIGAEIISRYPPSLCPLKLRWTESSDSCVAKTFHYRQYTCCNRVEQCHFWVCFNPPVLMWEEFSKSVPCSRFKLQLQDWIWKCCLNCWNPIGY